MMQTELQNEFNELIKEISKEVLELSVSKSIENASFMIKGQVPTMTNNIKELKKALESLYAVKTELANYQKETQIRENKVDSQLISLIKKVENESKLVEEVKMNLSSFQKETKEKAKVHQDEILEVRGVTKSETKKLGEQLDTLHSLTNEGVIKGKKTNHLLIWTFIISLGSFGILTTILLQTLKIISL